MRACLKTRKIMSPALCAALSLPLFASVAQAEMRESSVGPLEYLEANDLGLNSYNNFSAKPNNDGSYTIHFGGDPKSINYLPVSKGWNYAVRMYQPRKEILDGTWTFPDLTPVQ